jgi:hypothetical protein
MQTSLKFLPVIFYESNTASVFNTNKMFIYFYPF